MNKITENLRSQEEFLARQKRNNKLISILRVLILLIFLAIWEVLSTYKVIDSFFFSSPFRIINLFINMCKNHTIYIIIN